MGDIYASAELCLVAVAGTDPSHGLPGVTRSRVPAPTPRHVRLGEITLLKWPSEVALDIFQSVWASRAWTNQEGYLSRRRLFFTQRQTLFICDEMCGSDAAYDATIPPRSDLRHVRSMFPTFRRRIVGSLASDPLRSALGMEEHYSQRSISYESDALNAIRGALATLKHRSKPIHHICGVLVGKVSNSSHVCVALSWSHPQPCRKRKEFPSWTWLGWKGELQYLWSNPEISNKLFIRVGTSANSLESISSLEENRYETLDSPGYPTHLEITAPTLVLDLEDLHFTDAEQEIHAQHKKTPYVVLPAQSEFQLYGVPYWDEDVSTDDQHGLLGIVLSSTVEFQVHYWVVMIQSRFKSFFREAISH